MNEIVVTANGKQRGVAAGSTVAGFLQQLDLAAERVVVEYNGEPLERKRFAQTALRAGDSIEIAQMVGGG